MTFPDVTNAPPRSPGDIGKTGVLWRPQLNQAGGTASGGGGSNVTIEVSGPLLRGLAPAFIAGMLDEIKYLVASQVLADWQQNMDRAFRHPTPYYETQVLVQQVREDQVVHDRGIAYGPWLEGVSTRNQVSRFKGYGSLRRAVESVVRHKAAPIIDRVVNQTLRRMMGGGG